MVQVTGTLSNGKPIIDVSISRALSYDQSLIPLYSKPVLPLRPYRALIDTGADITCICDQVVKDVGLKAHAMTSMTGANGRSTHRVFMVNVSIWCSTVSDFEGQNLESRSLYQIEAVEAAEIRNNSWFDLIIGTDILSKFSFSLKKGGDFILDFS